MRKLQAAIFLFLISDFYSHSQQNNTWYFGLNAGISFNLPQPRIPYPLTNSHMNSFEGSSCISDANGNIILYTNSKSIYNKYDQVVLNGDNLLGHESAYQSSLIVPLPNSDSIFYVFTADAFENNFENGYRYSIVDISRNNGNGEVIAKNTLLFAPGTERLTAARHANGIDVWIITNDHSSNIFRAFLLTCNGLQPAVVSTTGQVMNLYGSMNVGSMKVSPDGKLLCQTHFPDFLENFLTNFFQLFAFDNATGVISNPKTISAPGAQYAVCEFSPDSKLLYVTQPYLPAIDQFEVQLPTAAAIAGSRYSIAAPVGYYGIMAAPDNKIYLNRSITKLSVIEKPNVKGAGCNFQTDNIDLAGRSGGIGFPGFINDFSFDPYNNFSYRVLDSCSGILQFEPVTNLPGSIQWEWDFGDGTSSTLQNPVHNFQQSNQLYYVKLKIKSTGSCGYVEKGKSISTSGLYTKAAFDFVSVCDSAYVRFTNKSYTYPERNVGFLWDFGDGSVSTEENPIHVFDHSGLYTVNLKMNTGLQCLDDAVSVDLNFSRLVIDAHPDVIVIEEGQSIQMDVTGNGDQFFWSPSIWLSDPFIRNPVATPLKDTAYIVVVKTNAGCLDADTVFVKVKNLNEVYVPTAFTPNNDGKNDVFKPRIGLLFTLDEFSIYNRWGQRIFTTHEPTKGWDGRVNGMLQSQGVFVWKLRAKDQQKKVVEKKGTVVLIR